MRQHLLHGLLALRMGITSRVKQSLDHGALHIKLCKVSYRGVPAWLKLGTLSSDVPAKAALACAPGLTMFSDRRIGEFWLSCSICSIRKEVQHTTLFLRGKWTTLTCRHCGSSHSARLWLCVCGLPWHGCGLHAHRGYTCRTRPRRACLNSGASKRDPPGPSNLLPIPSLLAPPSGSAKRPHPACDSRSQARVACARAAPTRARKRKFCSTQPLASDLEAVARIRDARANPVPAESSHISTHCREKGQGDATPPLALIFFEIVADSEFRPLLFFSN